MRIALLDAFPALAASAEKEFITRAIGVLHRLGHEAIEVCTSDQIVNFDPDLVLSTHDLAPKLTEHFTAGLLWSPTVFYKNSPERLRIIRSWDLVVPINEETRQFAIDLHFPTRHDSAVSETLFYPSSPIVDVEQPDPAKLSLAYVGVHWDGDRHGPLLHALAEMGILNVYGPPESWKHLPHAYRGMIPFDGRSLMETLNRHGAVLALHKPTHRDEDTPSMRVFEACAAKCLVITDPMPSLKRLLGEAAEYVDTTQDAQRAAKAIRTALEAARANPEATAVRMAEGHRRFREAASLEVLLPRLLDEVARRRAAQRATPPRAEAPPVSVIIRCGSRPVSVIARAVRSLERQLYPNVALIFARFAEVEGFDTYVDELRASGRFHSIQVVDVDGDGRRSTSLWAGLRQVTTPFFSVLDDDDEVLPDHLLHVMATFERQPSADLVYSGSIRHEEEGALANLHPRLQLKDGSFVDESRELAFMDAFDLGRLLTYDNVILSHSFVARSSLLTAEVLDDPKLEVMEDVYLYMLLAARGAEFAFNGRASAVWNWRSRSSGNSMLSVPNDKRRLCAEKIIRRLGQHHFPGSYLGLQVIGRGYSNGPPAGTEASYELDGYDETLEDGIVFKRPDMPRFVSSVSGLSFREGWGRWTDGERAEIGFRQPLPKQFVLEIVGRPADSMIRQKVYIEIGSFRRGIRMWKRNPAAYRVRVNNGGETNTIALVLPGVRSPAELSGNPSADTRRLGFALSRIRVLPWRPWLLGW